MDKDEYAKKVQELYPKLYALAYLHLGSDALANDAISEAVYRGLVSVKKLREPAYFRTWLTRILINECNKIWRKRKREVPVETIPDTPENEKAYDALPLKEAISRLPTDLKEVIVLRYYADFTLAETSKCLNIPQGTAATRARRALQLLKLELEEKYEQE